MIARNKYEERTNIFQWDKKLDSCVQSDLEIVFENFRSWQDHRCTLHQRVTPRVSNMDYQYYLTDEYTNIHLHINLKNKGSQQTWI